LPNLKTDKDQGSNYSGYTNCFSYLSPRFRSHGIALKKALLNRTTKLNDRFGSVAVILAQLDVTTAFECIADILCANSAAVWIISRSPWIERQQAKAPKFR
jgi:hypothetical protein